MTVTSMKLEQSFLREVSSGIFPVRVPVTALAQPSALHAERTPWTSVRAEIKDKGFIIKPVKVNVHK